MAEVSTTPLPAQPQYFSIRQFFALCWAHKIFIISFTSIFAVASVFIALAMPNQYATEVLVVPSEEQQGGGLSALANQFGGLASLAGINLKGKGSDSTQINIDTFKSKRFIMGFIEKHDLLVPLMAGKRWDPDTKKLILNEKIYDEASKKWVRKVSYPKQVKPSLQEAYVEFMKRLSLKRDAKSGVITIGFEFLSPIAAQQWLTTLVSDFNQHMLEIERARSKKSIEYLNEQIEKTQVAELKNVFYQLVQEQIKTAMLAEVRNEFVFETIDPALVPELKSKPSRALICLVITLFGGLFSIFIVHIRQAFGTTRLKTLN